MTEGEKTQFTTEQVTKIEELLDYSAVPEILAKGKQTEIEVPDYDLGRSLVKGKKPILKRKIDELLETGGKLNAKKCRFIVADFTQLADPKEVLEALLKKIPKIHDPRLVHRGDKTFSDFYPGKVVVLLGVDAIPITANVFDMRNVAKHAPTVFIHKPFPKFTSDINKYVFGSLGDYSFGKCILT